MYGNDLKILLFMKTFLFSFLFQYATLCLAHTDKEQFQEFVSSLTNISDSRTIIKKCTKISQQN